MDSALPNLRIQPCCFNCIYRRQHDNYCLFLEMNQNGKSIKIKSELVCDAHTWRDPIRYVNRVSMKFHTQLPEELQP